MTTDRIDRPEARRLAEDEFQRFAELTASLTADDGTGRATTAGGGSPARRTSMPWIGTLARITWPRASMSASTLTPLSSNCACSQSMSKP